MATGYGGWIAGDDWRAVVEATVSNNSNGTSCTVTVTGKLQNVYAISGQANWTGAVSSSSTGTSSTNFGNFGQNTTVTIKTNSFTVSRTHAAQTITAKCAVTSPSGSSYGVQTSTATVSLTIPARASYTVDYDANGGSGAPSSQTKWHGESLTLSSTSPTRTGYTFGGSSGKWHAVGGDSGWYDPGDSYTANASATLYAAWTAKTYAVKYNANGGSGAPSAQTKTYGTTLKLSTTKPTRAGYTFTGWDTKSDGSGTSYAAGANYTANAAVTLYAQWSIITYEVKYSANGGSGSMSSQSKNYGGSLTVKSNAFTYSGHTFTGWNTKADGSGTSYSAGATYSANADATLYAQWKLNTYTVKYAANGGSSTPASQTKTHGRALTLSGAISRTSSSVTYTVTFDANGGTVSPTSRTATKTTTYEFYRWKSTAGTLYTASDSYDVDAATTMTAQWTSNTSTGSVALPTPTRANYSFGGWYTAATGGTRVTSPYTPTANVTLHAHWSLAYTAPKFTKLTAVRCRQDGTADDEGTYCALTATWTDGSVAISDVTFEVGGTSYAGTISGTEATALAGTLSTEQRYTVTATVTDGTTTLRKTTVLTPAYFTLDFFAGGKGVAIGMAAAAEGFFVKLATTIYDALNVITSTINRDTDSPAETYGTGLYLRDVDGEALGTLTPYQLADGETGVRLIAFNENTSGTQIYNIFRVGKKRDGTNTYGFSSATAFRNALGADSGVFPTSVGGTGNTEFGTIHSADISTAVSVPSGAYTNVHSVTLPQGTYILSYGVQFATNATGRRCAVLNIAETSNPSSANLRYSGISVNAVDGGGTYLHGSVLRTIGSAGETVYLKAWQNSGGALNAYGYFQYVRLK